MAERLQKILSQWGVASRRQAEQMILDGRVRLNGAVVVQLGQKADPTVDHVEVDGKPIHLRNRPELIYLLLHKPAGVVSTCRDPQKRTTVLDLLPNSFSGLGLHPVGRLDTASTGALLLTNDGDLTVALTHPRHSVPKTYRVWVQGHPSEAKLNLWRQGVFLDSRLTRPAQVQILETSRSATLLEIVLKEGRNRQIRRVAEQLGFPVNQLHRVAIGPIHLGKLNAGQYRPLAPEEVNFLYTQIQRLQPPTDGASLPRPFSNSNPAKHLALSPDNSPNE
jgi:pseudouridine synthase